MKKQSIKFQYILFYLLLILLSNVNISCATTEVSQLQSPYRSPEQEKFYNIKNTRDYTEIGLKLDYKITVDDEAKEIILLYEESIDEEDYKTQMYSFPWPLKLDDKTIWTTYGYAKIYKSSENQPIDEFYRLWLEHPDYKIIFRGWSLGSAMAKITARHFLLRAPEGTLIDELTTFGDIKCWLNPFFSLKENCVKIREYININDFITWLYPFYWRDLRCRVGGKLKLKKLFDCEYVHTHYDELDYSEWEDEE